MAEINYADDFGAFLAAESAEQAQVNIIPTTQDLDAQRANIPSNVEARLRQQAIEKARLNKQPMFTDPTTGEQAIPPQQGLEDTSLDLTDVASLGAGALVAGGVKRYGDKIADAIVDPKDLTAFGKDISKLTPEQQIKVNEAVDTLEGVGGNKFDETSLNKVATALVPTKSSKEVGLAGMTALAEKRDFKKFQVDQLYKKADVEGATTREVKTNNFIDNVFGSDKELQRIITGGKVENKSTVDAYNDIVAVFDDSLGSNAYRLEEKRKYLTDALGDAEGKSRTLYRNAIQELDKNQDALLREIGKPDLYKEARTQWKDMKTSFEGKRFSDKAGGNYGASGGRAIKEAIESGDTYNVAKTLFDGKLDVDKVEQVSRFLNKEQKSELGMEVLMNGIGREANSINQITTPQGMNKFISNLRGADDKSLVMLFGKDGANGMRKSADAMELVQQVIKSKSGDTTDIGNDVMSLISSVALFKVSPYVSGRMGVGSIKNIVTKKMFNQEKKELIKRTKGITNAKEKNALLKAISLASAGYAGYKTVESTGGKADSKTSTLGKISDKFSNPFLADAIKNQLGTDTNSPVPFGLGESTANKPKIFDLLSGNPVSKDLP